MSPGRWRETVKQGLDRPGLRGLLGAAASLWLSARNRELCRIHWQDGAWIHRYRDATIPHPRVAGVSRPITFTAAAREIFLYEYEPCEGDVVFDVGAGVGDTTLLFSRLVGPRGRVVALEAHPGTFAWLAWLCQLNELANVVPLQIAAADGEGELAISDDEHYASNSVVDPRGEGIKVPARRLDDVALELGISSVGFLKMNIEGAEEVALKGMQRLIEHTSHVCISCHDFLAERGASERMRTKAAVRAFLLDHGFRVTSREDAPEPWTRDYLYGVNTAALAPPAYQRSVHWQ